MMDEDEARLASLLHGMGVDGGTPFDEHKVTLQVAAVLTAAPDQKERLRAGFAAKNGGEDIVDAIAALGNGLPGEALLRTPVNNFEENSE